MLVEGISRISEHEGGSRVMGFDPQADSSFASSVKPANLSLASASDSGLGGAWGGQVQMGVQVQKMGVRPAPPPPIQDVSEDITPSGGIKPFSPTASSEDDSPPRMMRPRGAPPGAGGPQILRDDSALLEESL
mmetsp:Transcript_94027/g.242928  ORF Transcript_94027/g.242928 Transcript_94027/m.242928 type:complete len:133 (-) Transcript_94027:95-493(-)